MNNIMSDIQNGFVHRRLPDGGFKVCQPNVSWVIDFEGYIFAFDEKSFDLC